ncbi:MAG: hypothetical protein NC181_04165 [Clostridium sp.]|nr:hypothetical protein [Clostridium sp.]MCM1444458.1 hypothetical protein [Candidatus Amulumruptor caecigallinarius]
MKRKIIEFIKKALFKFYKLKVNIYNLLNHRKYNVNIALVSCDKLKNKVTEDIYLKHYLNKNKAYVDIISWQDESIDYNKYDFIIIRSIWGFQNYQESFDKWLKKLEEENIKVYNSISIIKNSYNKEIQFNILHKNNIKTIETKFIYNYENLEKEILSLKENDFKKYNLLITKPTISESSKDTYLVGSTNENYNNLIDISEINNKYLKYKNRSKIMVQPFLKEVFDGEYSITCLNNKITHAVIKYVNIFNNTNIIKYIPVSNLDYKIIELTQSILNIKEYKDSLYMRVDLIKYRDEFLVMEVELLDPNLFLSFIPNKKYQKQVLNNFCKEVVEKNI